MGIVSKVFINISVMEWLRESHELHELSKAWQLAVLPHRTDTVRVVFTVPRKSIDVCVRELELIFHRSAMLVETPEKES